MNCSPKYFKVIAGVIFAIGGIYYLWGWHRAHVLQYFPLALFLMCPLMHFFGGHGHSHGSESGDGKSCHHDSGKKEEPR